MEKPTFESLVDQMKRKDTTRQWDVLVSYDEDKVSGLLKASQLTELEKWPEFAGTAVNEDDKDVEIVFELEMSTHDNRVPVRPRPVHRQSWWHVSKEKAEGGGTEGPDGRIQVGIGSRPVQRQGQAQIRQIRSRPDGW